MTWGVLMTIRSCDPLDPPNERLLDWTRRAAAHLPEQELAETTARALGSMPDATFRAARLDSEGRSASFHQGRRGLGAALIQWMVAPLSNLKEVAKTRATRNSRQCAIPMWAALLLPEVVATPHFFTFLLYIPRLYIPTCILRSLPHSTCLGITHLNLALVHLNNSPNAGRQRVAFEAHSRPGDARDDVGEILRWHRVPLVLALLLQHALNPLPDLLDIIDATILRQNAG